MSGPRFLVSTPWIIFLSPSFFLPLFFFLSAFLLSFLCFFYRVVCKTQTADCLPFLGGVRRKESWMVLILLCIPLSLCLYFPHSASLLPSLELWKEIIDPCCYSSFMILWIQRIWNQIENLTVNLDNQLHLKIIQNSFREKHKRPSEVPRVFYNLI